MSNSPPSGWRVFRVKTRRVNPSGPAAPAETGAGNPQFAHASPSSRSAHEFRPGPAPHPEFSGARLLAGPVRCVLAGDPHGTWAHYMRSYDGAVTGPECLGHQIIASGPLVSVVREQYRLGSSEVWLEYRRLAGSGDLELRVRFNLQETRRQLRLEIPTHLAGARTAARMPAETAVRPADGAEYPCHDWVVIEGQCGGRPAALAVLNDSTYSYSARDGLLRFTLARGVPHAEHPPFEYKDLRAVPLLDQGWQERRFLLRALDPAWSPGALTRDAEAFQIPPVTLLDSAHPGVLPREQAGLSVSPENVSVLGVQPAPGGGLLARLAETDGKPVTARLTLGAVTATAGLAPFQIRSFHISTAGKT